MPAMKTSSKGNISSSSKNMDAQLRAFLDEHRVNKGEPFTHTAKLAKTDAGVLWSAGSYYIGVDDAEKFLTLYCNAVAARAYPTLAERPTPVGKPIGPLRVDFDLKTTMAGGAHRQYTDDILRQIVGFYQQAIKQIIQHGMFEDKMLWCIVLEKPAPRKEKDATHGVVIKDGFHLHFPHFICSGWTQDHYLRDSVTHSMISEKTWAGVDFVEGVETIIDKTMATKMWMMYGSMNHKNAKSVPYLATKAYDHDLQTISFDDVFEDEMSNRKMAVSYYLPRFLSIKGYDSETPLSDQFTVRMPKPRKPTVTRTRSDEQVAEDLKRIKDGGLLSYLSEARISDYIGWMDIGWTLFNIGQGSDEALEMWIEVSQRSDKFLDGACEDEWSKMEMRGKTMGSLIKMIAQDRPEEYNEWRTGQIDYYIDESLVEKKATECDIAAVVFRMYEGRFVCTKSKKDKWFEFKNHRWFELDDAHSIKFLLSTEVRAQYTRYIDKLNDDRRRTQDDLKIKTLDEKVIRCLKISRELKTVPFHKKVVEALKLRMMDDKFEDKLDCDPLLLGCENGVLDLKIGQFREGRPDDYISRTTKIFYREYDEHDIQVIELRKFFKKVFPDPELYSYFFDFFTSCLEAGNIHKTLLVATGNGNNGKSKTFKMLEFTFGEYCTKFSPETLVAGRGQVGGTRTDLIRARYSRIALCDEIAAHEKVNLGAVKQITGGDSVPARDLYEGARDQKDIQAQFTLCIQCLAEGTMVSLPCGISVPIETLSNNKELLVWDASAKQIVVKKQLCFIDQGSKPCITLILSNGESVTCTPNHRFLSASEEWIRADSVVLGSTCLMTQTGRLLVVRVEDAGVKHVYDLTVEKPYSNFIANGLVSHNCNDLFKIPGQDDAMWERVRVLIYESEFVKPKDLDKKVVPKTPEEQFKAKKFIADLGLNDNWLRDQAPVLLWILFRNFKRYKERGIKEPDKVKASTDSYRGQNDVYRQFLKDHLLKVTKDDAEYASAKVGVVEAFKLFQGWYKNNYPSYAKSTPIDSYNFKHEMTKRMCKSTGVGKNEHWPGWTLLEDEEDPSDNSSFFAKVK